MRDSTIHDNGSAFDPSNPGDPTTLYGGGILVAPTGSGSAQVVLDNVRLINNTNNGMQIFGPASVAVGNSTVSGSTNHGIWVLGTSGAVSLNLDNSLVANNAQGGVFADGTGAQAWLWNSTISGSLQGIRASGKGAITSFGNNRIYNNTVNGRPTATSPLQ